MLPRVTVAAAIPEAQALQIYDLVAEPVARLTKWTLRRRRGISDAELQATAYGLIADFQELLSASPLAFQTRVVRMSDKTVEEADRLAEDRAEQESEEQEQESFNALLLTVRRCRGDLLGPGGQALERALKARRPQLATEYRETLAEALNFMAELERMLVLLGAGTEEDAELGMPLIPIPPDMPPGPTVYMDL
jgi:hypothetical protein